MDDPLQPHSHEPNPDPPHGDPAFYLSFAEDSAWKVTPADLRQLPQTAVPGCFIISTGHGTSGPFTFGGVTLGDLIAAYSSEAWRDAEIVSADGFGCRIDAAEVLDPAVDRPILLATQVDGRPLRRQEGLIRLIVPAEKGDALRQVKWVRRVRVSGEQ